MTPTIITTCMGRLAWLKQSLPTWLEHTSFNVLVVDYACPDGTAAWVLGLREPRVHQTRADVGSHTKFFNKSRALNWGVNSLWSHRNDWGLSGSGAVLLLDADTKIVAPLSLDVGPGEMWLVAPTAGTRDLTGVLACDVRMLLAVGGFDEDMLGWGGEDLDLRTRLYLHSKPELKFLPAEAFASIEHGDELRSRYYVEKSLELSSRRNLDRMVRKLGHAALSELLASGHAELLLGAGARRT